MKEIPVTEVGPVCIGQTENPEAGTGCTVLIAPQGMCAGLDVRGGGPASRESQLLHPLMAAQSIHAIVLAGGSAYGLGAADGVMRYLEEKGIGYDTGYARVPLVAQADIYDLSMGDAFVRPDAEMGYEAARRALEAPNYQDGNYGAGCGATVGKLAGMDYCMKSGIGSYAVRIGELKIGAIVAVLVAIAIPVFTSQLEKSREAVDQANIRDAYAQLVAATLTEETTITSTSNKITFTAGTAATGGSAYIPPTATVTATQQVTGWASGTNPVIAGASVNASTTSWSISVDAATGVATITAN